MIDIKRKEIYFYSLLIISIILKFIFLDQDLPSQRLTEYNEYDQFWYTQPVRSWILHYYCLLQGFDYPRIMFDLFQNFWTYPFLKIFGNNFYGFKIPTVILSIFIIYFLINILKEKNKRLSKVSMILILLISFDFMFNITSRVQNPCIYSLFGISFIFYLMKFFIETKNQNLKNYMSFLLGFFSIFLVFLIYIFNFFILASIFSFFLFGFLYSKKISLKEISLFLTGIFFGFIFYNLTTFLFFEKTFFDLIFSLRNFGGGDEFRVVKQLDISFSKKIKKHIGSIFLLSFFKLNLFYIPFIFGGLFVTFKNLLKKERLATFILLCLIFVNIQNWFEPHYISKKMIVLLPIFLILSKYSIEFIIHFKNENRKNKIGFLFFLFVGFIGSIYNYKMTTSYWYNELWFGDNMSHIFNFLNFSLLFIITILLFFYSYYKNELLIFTLVVLSLLPSSFMIYSEILTNRSYNCKKSLIELHNIIDDNNVYNGNNFTLYNNFTCSGSSLHFIDITEDDDFIFNEIDYLLLISDSINNLKSQKKTISLKEKDVNPLFFYKSLYFNQGKYLNIFKKK